MRTPTLAQTDSCRVLAAEMGVSVVIGYWIPYIGRCYHSHGVIYGVNIDFKLGGVRQNVSPSAKK